MSEKLAITVKHEFSEDGKYLGSDVFRSAIYIGTVYRKSQVDLLIKEEGNRNLVKLYNLLKGNSKKSPSNTIISQINNLTANYLEEYLNKQRIPKIYESTFYLSDTDALDIITKYTDKTFEHASFLDFLALFKEVTDKQVQYTVEDIGDTILKIDTPFRTYLDYRNLKIIDYILKYKKMSRGEKYLLKDELRDLSTRASAVKLATKTKK